MGPMKTFFRLCDQMRGAKVIHKRMFLDTLQLYLLQDERNDRANAMEIWCESPWQLLDATSVLADASTTFVDDIEDRTAARRLVSKAADVLRDRTVEDIFIVRENLSLRVVFSGDFEVWTFPVEDGDPEHEQWMLRGSGGQPEVAGCADEVYLVERDHEGRRI